MLLAVSSTAWERPQYKQDPVASLYTHIPLWRGEKELGYGDR